MPARAIVAPMKYTTDTILKAIVKFKQLFHQQLMGVMPQQHKQVRALGNTLNYRSRHC